MRRHKSGCIEHKGVQLHATTQSEIKNALLGEFGGENGAQVFLRSVDDSVDSETAEESLLLFRATCPDHLSVSRDFEQLNCKLSRSVKG